MELKTDCLTRGNLKPLAVDASSDVLLDYLLHFFTLKLGPKSFKCFFTPKCPQMPLHVSNPKPLVAAKEKGPFKSYLF